MILILIRIRNAVRWRKSSSRVSPAAPASGDKAGPRRLSLPALAALPPERRAALMGGDAVQTAAWLYEAAHAGIPEAQTALGQALLDGIGTPVSPAGARRWFLHAARAGHAPAQNMLGRCFERGWGGAVDPVAAARCYRQAAVAGLDWGQYNLANMLLRGRGVPRDRVQALAWFSAAAAQGHAKSMNLVGRFLEEGWTGPPNPAGARTWYERAAEAGDFRAQFNLSTLLQQEGNGKGAAFWLEQAEAGATPDFRKLIATILPARAGAANGLNVLQ